MSLLFNGVLTLKDDPSVSRTGLQKKGDEEEHIGKVIKMSVI